MVLHELYGGSEVSRVELVWNIPPDGPELTSFLHGCVEECYCIEHRFPLVHVGVIQGILTQGHESSPQTRLDALWRLVREFYTHLKSTGNFCFC